jgi:pimeloyl-ACP methyl ester carboxylesterase
MSVLSVKKSVYTSRSEYFTLHPLSKDSIPVKIHYLTIDVEASSRPLVVFFTGFGEQNEKALYSASRPFVEKGFSTIAVALPFHKMSPELATWLINNGLRDFLKHIAPAKTFVLAGTSRGAAIAACATKLTSNCEGLAMILPFGLSKITARAYVRRAFWDYLVGLSFLDKAARRTSRAVIHEAWHHMKNPGGLTGAFRLAMAQTENVTNSLKIFDVATKKLAVFVGKKDRVFTLQECSISLKQLLGEKGEQAIIPLNGGHSTVGSKLGQSQLRHVAQWLATEYPGR